MTNLEVISQQICDFCNKQLRLKEGLLVQLKLNLTPTKIFQFYDIVKQAGYSVLPSGQDKFLIMFSQNNSAYNENLRNISLNDLIEGPIPRLDVPFLEFCQLYEDMKQNGQRERIIVRPSSQISGKYEIVDGNKRHAVAKQLCWYEIKAIVKEEMTEQEAYETYFSINDNQSQFDRFDKGRFFTTLMKKFPEVYSNPSAVAKKFCLSENHVIDCTNRYSYLRKHKKGPDRETPVFAGMLHRVLLETGKESDVIDGRGLNPNLIIGFLSKRERRDLLEMFLLILGNGCAITTELIKTAAKTINVDRTTVAKLVANPNRIPSDETTAKILDFLLDPKYDCIKYDVLTSQRLKEIKKSIILKINSAFFSVHK